MSSTSERRYARLMALFGELCELAPVERAPRLIVLDAEDPELAAELRDLLDADEAEHDDALLGRAPETIARGAAADLLAAGHSLAPDVGVDELLAPGQTPRWPDAETLLLPGYSVSELRGAGGSGAVYRATRQADGSQVAIKLLAPALGTDRRSVERFEREFMAIARLDHPHCLRVFERGRREASFHYFVMEYLPGDLSTLVGAPLPTCLEAGRQITGALAYLHGRGLVHRDLKPSNVLVAQHEPLLVKLGDFGTARGDGLAQITEAGKVLGTLGYLAPERFEPTPGGEADLDPRVDLYALGCLLFELISGELPFRVPWELRAPPEAKRHIRRLVPDAPEALDALLCALLARQPGDRPGAAEVRQRLGAIGQGDSSRC